MQKFLGIILALLVATALPSGAQHAGQQQADPPKQEKKPEAKPPASVAGKWNMSLDTPQGAMPATLDLKLEGKKVTGTLSGPQGDIALEGEFADGKLSFSITFQGGGGEMQITFNSALKEDGTLVGTFDFGQGQMNWKAERAK